MVQRKTKKAEEYQQSINQALQVLNGIAEDSTTPRNIRRCAKNAAEGLLDETQSHAVRTANAISTLDEVSQDPNMPPYTRTRIWNVVSLLETVKD